MLTLPGKLCIPDDELVFSAIRAQGAGGQNVNKVSSAVHLRFDVRNSSLPPALKKRLLATRDRRINKDGIIVIKAQSQRTRERNRADALARLAEMIHSANRVQKPRKPTRPSRASQRRRMDSKTRHSRNKSLRRKPEI